jgi:tetratricopeptide (TPR) repeat protein
MSEAYTLFLRSREIGERTGISESGYRAQLRLLEEAVQLDPNLGIAWAHLSWARLAFYLDHPESGDRDTMRGEVLKELEHALELSPQLADTHLASARFQMYSEWDWKRAEAEMRRALELGPSNAAVQRNAYYLSTFLGRWDEALEHARRATELDPLSSLNFTRFGDAQQTAGALDNAERAYRIALNLDPEAESVPSSLAEVLSRLGKNAEALAENARERDEANRLYARSYIEAKSGHHKEAAEALKEFILKYGRSRPFDVGTLYANSRLLDDAFLWWNRAIDERNLSIVYFVSTIRNLDMPAIPSDPRYKAILRRMSLPE